MTLADHLLETVPGGPKPRPAVYKSTSYENGKNRVSTAINIPAIHAAEYAGLAQDLYAAWERLKKDNGIGGYVTFDKIAKVTATEVADIGAQLKFLWLQDRTSVSFQIDRMGANIAFRFNQPPPQSAAPTHWTRST